MEKVIRIGNRKIGSGEPAFIIAEIGSNHDGKLSRAKELIKMAARCGADAVKFQIFSAAKLYPKSDPLYPMFKKNEVPKKWLGALSDYAKRNGVIFLSSPFDRDAVDWLDEIDVAAYKWASRELFDLALLKYAALKRRPLILSTAMCNLADIQKAIDTIVSCGNNRMVLLHCTSLYPTEPRYANLRMMDTMRVAFHLPVGFSDHTMGISVPIAAAARGVCVIEKHFTLSRKLKGPDHSFAIEPGEFTTMIKYIREVEESLGSSVKSFIRGVENPINHRKSIVAIKDIAKGVRLSEDVVAVKRSLEGIQAKYIDLVLGREAVKDIKEDEPVTWDAI